jgi:hypothetical protein
VILVPRGEMTTERQGGSQYLELCEPTQHVDTTPRLWEPLQGLGKPFNHPAFRIIALLGLGGGSSPPQHLENSEQEMNGDSTGQRTKY